MRKDYVRIMNSKAKALTNWLFEGLLHIKIDRVQVKNRTWILLFIKQVLPKLLSPVVPLTRAAGARRSITRFCVTMLTTSSGQLISVFLTWTDFRIKQRSKEVIWLTCSLIVLQFYAVWIWFGNGSCHITTYIWRPAAENRLFCRKANTRTFQKVTQFFTRFEIYLLYSTKAM